MILRNTLILTVTVIIVVTLLSLVNSYTAPIIDENNRIDFQDQINTMFPDYARIEKTPSYEKGQLIGEYYQIIDKFDEVIGYAVEQDTNGYGGEIRLLVGFYSNKTIKSVKILSQTETPGIGTRIKESSFLNRFHDKKDIKGVDTITGATISSTAVINGIQKALEKLR